MNSKSIDNFFIEYYNNKNNNVEHVKITDNNDYKTITIKFSDIPSKVFNYNNLDGYFYNNSIIDGIKFSKQNLSESLNKEWLLYNKK